MTQEQFKDEVTQYFEGDLVGALAFICQVFNSQRRGWKLTSLEHDFAAQAGAFGWGQLLRSVAEAYESWPEEKQR